MGVDVALMASFLCGNACRRPCVYSGVWLVDCKSHRQCAWAVGSGWSIRLRDVILHDWEIQFRNDWNMFGPHAGLWH